MNSPLHRLHFGTFPHRRAIGYWHGWRFWCWRPRRTTYFSGGQVVWRWLCFEIMWEQPGGQP